MEKKFLHQWFHEEHIFHATKGSSLFTERFFEKQKWFFYASLWKFQFFHFIFKILWMLKVLRGTWDSNKDLYF